MVSVTRLDPMKMGRRGLTFAQRFMSYVIPEPNSGCWLWLGSCNQDGYGNFGIKHQTAILAHRASYMMFRGEVLPDQKVLHRCDVPCCVNPDHLWLGSQLENIADRTKKGRSYRPIGSLSKTAKLTYAQVNLIRQAALSHRKLAHIFGVARGVIWQIKTGKTWKEHG